jgi:peptide/nickel transport system permease protein
MPELPSSPAERLAAEEDRLGMPPSEPLLQGLAVETGPEGGAAKRAGLGVAAWSAIAWMVIVIGSAVLAPLLPLKDPLNYADSAHLNQGPSLHHLMGLDGSGRDVLSRVVYGGRVSLVIGFGSIAIGFLLGGVLGLIAGYFKGRIGGFIGSVLDIFLAFPQLILALAVVTFLGRTTTNVTIALAIVSTPVLARIARASTLTWSEREFVLAARAQGARHRRIMFREILPNVLPAMFSLALLGIAVVIVAEGGLAILGASVKPQTVSWGNVIVSGKNSIANAPHIALAPSIVIFLTVLALNYLGDVIRARFDVRESSL